MVERETLASAAACVASAVRRERAPDSDALQARDWARRSASASDSGERARRRLCADHDMRDARHPEATRQRPRECGGVGAAASRVLREAARSSTPRPAQWLRKLRLRGSRARLSTDSRLRRPALRPLDGPRRPRCEPRMALASAQRGGSPSHENSCRAKAQTRCPPCMPQSTQRGGRCAPTSRARRGCRSRRWRDERSRRIAEPRRNGYGLRAMAARSRWPRGARRRRDSHWARDGSGRAGLRDAQKHMSQSEDHDSTRSTCW